jgi:hypothetical protein
MSNAKGKDQDLVDLLGWFSLGLGAAQLIAPGLVNRVAGIENDSTSRLVQRLVGVREVGAFAAIEADRPRPALPIWGRVAGDCMDLALLGISWRRARAGTARLALTTASIVAVTGLDAYAASRLSAAEGGIGEIGPHHRASAAVTIRRPREEVVSAWGDRERQIGASARVDFVAAPDERGIEVHLRAEGVSTERAKDLLRRFKQELETGNVVRSEATPEGADPGALLRQRPARPIAQGSHS